MNLNDFLAQNGGAAEDDIIKAIIAGSQTGRDLTDTLSSGPSLKPESLDPVVKILENRDKHIVLWKMFPKKSVFNTVHEYNQLVSYGQDVGIFMNEGESPEQTDSVYRRKAALVKYMGLQGELTQQAMLVKQADGKDPYTREVENKTMKLLTLMDGKLSSGQNKSVAQEFDGIFAIHKAGISDIVGSTDIDLYEGDTTYIDARGKALTDSMVEDAAQAVVNDRFGDASMIISNPSVFNQYVKRFHESKRVIMGGNMSGVVGATGGQSVNDIMTQFGKIDIANDIFFDRKNPRLYNAAATSSKAPAAVSLTNNTCLVAAAADTKTKFGTAFAGSYFWAIAARNQYGESAMQICNTTIKAVAATESMDITFTAGVGVYPATGFVVYRTELGVTNYTSAKFYPIFEVSAAELAAGYDGGAAGKVRDRNREIPNTKKAIVLEPGSDMWEFIQLMSTMKLDFAITTLAKRFVVINFGAPIMYMPGKMAVINNLGSDLTD